MYLSSDAEKRELSKKGMRTSKPYLQRAGQLNSRSRESGMLLFIVLGLVALVGVALYAGHLLITCYRFAQFQSTLRSYIGMEATVDDMLKEESVRAYLNNKDPGVQLIRAVHTMLKRGDFDNAAKRLEPVAASDTNARVRIESSLKLIEEAQAELKGLGGQWEDLVRVRAAESQEYLKLRQDTAHLLSTELTEEELPTELNRVDVVTTGPLPFYERGELVGLPVLQTIPDNLDKKALVASLASTYQKSIARVGKEAAVDPAADYRHIQVRARHLKRRNEVTAKALYEVHRKTMEHLSVSRNARNSIQGLLYISLENRMRPKLPKWVPELYEFIRHHARKFGHIFPPVDMMPTY